MGSVIYLTGVPGTGKTTVASALNATASSSIALFSYSERLGRHLGANRDELRKRSGSIVAAEAVVAVDEELREFVAEQRSLGSVLIDSHAVTYERYGYRVIPFKPSVLRDLRLDAIVCLTAPPAEVAARLDAAPDGRPRVSQAAIEQAQRLQEAVAVSYSLCGGGIPLYVVNAGGPVADTVLRIASILARL